MQSDHTDKPPEKSPTQHAFIVAGRATPFLVHMTMMHMEEHSYQLVLRATLPDSVSRELDLDRLAHPDATYFLGNRHGNSFTVPQIQSGLRRSFIADIWRGIPEKDHYAEWPWNGITPAIAGVLVTIHRVVFYRHFDQNMNWPATLSYQLFGEGDEAHITNFQIKEPDFDHVASLAMRPDWMTEVRLMAGMPVNFPAIPARPVSCEDPLGAGPHLVKLAGAGDSRPIEVSRTLWFSTKVVNLVDPCQPAPPSPRRVDAEATRG